MESAGALALAGVCGVAGVIAGEVSNSAENAYKSDSGKLSDVLSKKLLSVDGTFIDETLEADYQVYFSRKTNGRTKESD